MLPLPWHGRDTVVAVGRQVVVARHPTRRERSEAVKGGDEVERCVFCGSAVRGAACFWRRGQWLCSNCPEISKEGAMSWLKRTKADVSERRGQRDVPCGGLRRGHLMCTYTELGRSQRDCWRSASQNVGLCWKATCRRGPTCLGVRPQMRATDCLLSPPSQRAVFGLRRVAWTRRGREGQDGEQSMTGTRRGRSISISKPIESHGHEDSTVRDDEARRARRVGLLRPAHGRCKDTP